jgi:hypothetical protein
MLMMVLGMALSCGFNRRYAVDKNSRALKLNYRCLDALRWCDKIKKPTTVQKTVVGIFALPPVCRSADGKLLAPFIGREEKIAP